MIVKLTLRMQKTYINPHKANLPLAGFLLVIFLWGLSGAVNAATVTASVSHHIFYVSTKGNSNGKGSRIAPWDLQTALNQPASVVMPGDSIIIEGGSYIGHFKSSLTGTQKSPIKVEAMFKNHVDIKSKDNGNVASLVINGSWTTYRNLVIEGTDPRSLINGPAGNKFIHVTVKDSKTHSGALNIKGKTRTITSRKGINVTLLGNITSGS